MRGRRWLLIRSLASRGGRAARQFRLDRRDYARPPCPRAGGPGLRREVEVDLHEGGPGRGARSRHRRARAVTRRDRATRGDEQGYHVSCVRPARRLLVVVAGTQLGADHVQPLTHQRERGSSAAASGLGAHHHDRPEWAGGQDRRGSRRGRRQVDDHVGAAQRPDRWPEPPVDRTVDQDAWSRPSSRPAPASPA